MNFPFLASIPANALSTTRVRTAMSLVGNLEDLGLGDILQIVSLSRKSGILSLQGRGREGRIVFQNGQVIRATSSAYRENVGDLLLRMGLIDLETLRQAVVLQRQEKQPQRLGAILSHHFGVSLDAIDTIVREQIEKIVYSFFGWTEGTFSFELGDQQELAATYLNPLQFMLDQGLNPQWLAMEGSRILDEKRHRGESLDEEPEIPVFDTESLLDLPCEPEAAHQILGEGKDSSVLLVDDDEPTRRLLAEILTTKGFHVRDFQSGKDLLSAVEQAVSAGGAPVLAIDLLMPRLDGSGILGGCELLEIVRKRFPALKTVIFSDHANAEAEHRVRQLGLQGILPKPKKSEVREESGRQALGLLGESIAEFLRQDTGAAATPMYDIGAELLREMGETETGRRPKGPESPGLYLLRGMLQELNNPALGGGIILLVLRFASELMNRAVIFLVKEKEIVGLGQFGIEISGEMADVRIRRMKIPRDGDCVLAQVLDQQMSPVKVHLGDGYWDNYLKDQLGGELPEQVFLGPILSEGKVVAILYGDNLPERNPIGDTEALEIFLSQAGLAMEKALLERRLRGREAV